MIESFVSFFLLFNFARKVREFYTKSTTWKKYISCLLLEHLSECLHLPWPHLYVQCFAASFHDEKLLQRLISWFILFSFNSGKLSTKTVELFKSFLHTIPADKRPLSHETILNVFMSSKVTLSQASTRIYFTLLFSVESKSKNFFELRHLLSSK